MDDILNKVGNGSMDDVVGKWTFHIEDGNAFTEHLNKSVPLYQMFHDLTLKMLDFYIKRPSPNNGDDYCNIVDLGCSHGIFAEKLLRRRKDVYVHLVDNEESMIDNAKKYLDKYDDRTQYYNIDVCEFLQLQKICDLRKGFIDNSRKEVDIFVSLFTLQFLPDYKKHEAVKGVYERLPAGGVFIYADKFCNPRSRMETLFAQLYDDFKMEQGITPQEIVNKKAALRGIQNPINPESARIMLLNSGFGEVHTFLSYLDFQGIIAIK